MTTSTSRVSRSMPGSSAMRSPQKDEIARHSITRPDARRRTMRQHMSPSSRRTLGLLIAAIVFVGVGGVSAWRVIEAHHEGWTGMSYVPRSAKPSPLSTPFGWVPGSVIIVFPASPADRAGIKPRDMVEPFNGIPITDWPRLQTLDQRTKTGDRILVHIARNGVARDVPITLESELRSPLIGGSMISSLIVGLV